MRNIFIVVFLFVFSQPVFAAGTMPQQKETAQSYIVGELIIKFRNDSRYIEHIEEVADGKRDLKDMDLGVYLNTLIKQYQLYEITRAYPKVLSAQEIAKKFPERARRVPKGVSVPDLRPTYLFKFKNPDVNMQRAALRFTKDGQVEYAQVNQLMTAAPLKQ